MSIEAGIEPARPEGIVPSASVGDPQLLAARELLREFRGHRAGWLGHLRSFLGVNLGLAAINVLSAIGAESIYPWFLYVTASWGVGLVIHGLSHRGWLKDRERSIRQAEAVLGVSRYDDDRLLPLPPGAVESEDAPMLGVSAEAAPLALPAGDDASEPDDGWAELLASCRGAVDEAERALDEAGVADELSAATREQLAKGLGTVDVVQRGARRISEAIRAVAPKGADSLDGELAALRSRIAKAGDERLRGVYEANLKLLEARRHKLDALTAEEERMRATVEGFLLAAQNVRLDAARLGAGHMPDRLTSLGDSLERLDEEVEVVRQVEAELEAL